MRTERERQGPGIGEEEEGDATAAAVAALPLSPARRLAVCSLPVGPLPDLVRERERAERGGRQREKGKER
uniref:Uncharacterized protein n=1 Tax=Oryza barthii TaxID=65489 RepID=A0A0D3F592_9ORYZ